MDEEDLEEVNLKLDRISDRLEKHLAYEEHKRDEGKKMGMENISDKLNINVGDGSGGGSMAAMMAAIGSRNNNDGMNNMWPLLLLALGRGRGGFLGGDGDGAGAGLGLQSSIDTNAIMQGLGDIKAAVPLAEAQVQLALAGSTADITNQTLQQTIALSNGQAQLGLSIANAVSTAKDLSAAQTQTLSGLINNVGTLVDRNLYQLSTAISCDGEKTRALITANQIADLNRLAQERQDEIIELRGNQRRDQDRHGIEINMINNQNQNQLQFQAQAQVLSGLTSALMEVGQIARATNSNVIVGNTGATTTGAMTASPTNVHA